MKRFETSLCSEFDPFGGMRVELVTEFAEPFTFWVWLGTHTDAERDRLLVEPLVLLRVQELADDEGLAALIFGVTVESQETVDRDYGGSWFHRLRQYRGRLILVISAEQASLGCGELIR